MTDDGAGRTDAEEEAVPTVSCKGVGAGRLFVLGEGDRPREAVGGTGGGEREGSGILRASETEQSVAEHLKNANGSRG